MKFIHLSDLHLGKRVNDYSMIEDQEYILNQIIDIVDTENPDGVIIAGDVYDKSIPSGEAVLLFDKFLTSLAERGKEVFVISGNHDSPERMSFASRLIEKSGIHISQVYDGNVNPYSVNDENGTVNIFMLPFIKPVQVRKFFDDEEITSYTEAMSKAISKMNIDPQNRNVLITHQFVTGSLRSDSEDILSVGGSDNVDVSVFAPFDYVALGHIHRPQNCAENVRYCGTPLKYSFSEANDKKSVTVVELLQKGKLSAREIPLVPLRDMVEIKGTYDEIISKKFYENTTYQTDYVHITLTDEEDVLDAVSKLRVVYKNLMKLDYDNKRTRNAKNLSELNDIESKSPFELFCDFYKIQNGSEMDDEQTKFMQTLIEKIWEEEK